MSEHSYRTIAPARPSSAEDSGPFGHGSGTLSQAGLRPGGEDEGTPRRRRRVTGKVSQLACMHCRRTRSKCDGDKAQACTRCISRGLQCLYQPHTKIQKDEILSELDFERGQRETITKEQRDSSIILDALTNNGHIDHIISRLKGKESIHSVAAWLLTFPDIRSMEERNHNLEGNLQDAVERIEQLYVRPDPSEDVGRLSVQWTSVTKNQAFLNHLFRLYFAWIHPHCTLFSEINFLDCYLSGDDTYCSSPLVNSICAMACNLLGRSQNEPLQTTSDHASLGEAFLREARSQIHPSDSPRITTLQSFAVMFLVELSSGKARNAATYLRCAADNLEDLANDGHKHEVYEASRWGIYTMNILWSGLTYQKPFNPQSPDTQIPFKIDSQVIRQVYQQYGEGTGSGQTFRAPAFTISTAVQQAKLFRIVHASINMYCGARGKISANSFLQCFRRLLDWKDQLPMELDCESYESQIPPNVLTLHLQYYASVIGQWSPLLYFLTGESTETSLVEEFRYNLLEYARDGVKLLELSLQDDTCRYFIPLVTFCGLHLCDALAHWSLDKQEKVAAVRLGCELLSRNRPGFQICGPLLQMFRSTIDQYADIDISEELDNSYGPRDQFTIDEILDASTRLSYTMPVAQIARWLDPDFQLQWPDEWIKLMGKSRRRRESVNRSMRVEDVMN